jgi:hypothetical protein
MPADFGDEEAMGKAENEQGPLPENGWARTQLYRNEPQDDSHVEGLNAHCKARAQRGPKLDGTCGWLAMNAQCLVQGTAKQQ